MKIKVGKYKVSLGDFITAVLKNTENQEIKFHCKDAEYKAEVKFSVLKESIQYGKN